MSKYSNWSNQKLISEYQRLYNKSNKHTDKASNTVPSGANANAPTLGNIVRASVVGFHLISVLTVDARISKIEREINRRGIKDY